jgi:iron complex outermembrane recepter protein
MQNNFTNCKKWALFTLAVLCSFAVQAQTKISGKIIDGFTKEALAGVNIAVKGKVIGTTTNGAGAFSLSTNTPVPFTVQVSMVGYKTQEVEINGDKVLNVSMDEQAIMGQEVVIAASRVEESVMKSPVTVEKMDIKGIRETPSASFYDGLSNIKGIDLTTQGLLFKSVNMRGFGATGNPRTVQMIDGMDNSAPGLNFPLDNIIGVPELDVESVEILPGSASALYGPNALNGLILMNSKSPFLYQGLSASVKTGILSASNRQQATSPVNDVTLRWAKAWNNKQALKFNISYLAAKDWEASNYTNLNVGGIENGSRGLGVRTDYDGANIYGDEAGANMITVANGLIANRLMPSAALASIPNQSISRTGFLERDLADYGTKSLKVNLAYHRRLSEKLEFIAQGNYGLGTTMYTGTGRYSLRNFQLGQYKLELRGDALTLRGYTTREQSGESYFAGLQALGMLNSIKPHATWFGEYVGAFATARGAGVAEEQAHLLARTNADRGMPTPGSAAFKALKEEYAKKLISNGGGAFDDHTNMYHFDLIYNLKNKIKNADVLVGANFRRYNLQSEGTLFSDMKDGRDGLIGINEFGAFVQAGKNLLDDKLKITASLRFDKNQNFEGVFSPRVTGVYNLGPGSLRLSYQTGFRIPTTQNQYIDLKTPIGTLIGGLDEFETRYKLTNGIPQASLSAANIAKFASDPAVQAQAKGYATAAVTAQASPVIKAGVEAAIKGAVVQAVTAGITAQVKDAVTKAIEAQVKTAVEKGIEAQVRNGVSQFIESQVKTGVTNAITTQVTAAVTANVNAAVAAGMLAADQAAAAIAAGVAAQLPGALAANLEAGVAAQLPAALAANLEAGVAAQLPAALAANYQTAYNTNVMAALAANLQKGIDANLPGALAANLDKVVAEQYPAAIAANYQAAFDAELAKALTANVPGVTNQVLPAFALAKIPKYNKTKLVPERIAAWEIGYKGLINNKLFFDAYYYNSTYRDMIVSQVVIVPNAAAGPGLPIESGVSSATTRDVYSRKTNTNNDVKVSGWAASMNYPINSKGYNIGANISSNILDKFAASENQLYAEFNSPKLRYNLSFGKSLKSGEKVGFNVILRSQSAFTWEAGFNQPSNLNAPLFSNTQVPKITNLDAQVSFKLPAFKSTAKIGGTNIGGNPYFQAFGSAYVGSMYYMSLTFDELFNK